MVVSVHRPVYITPQRQMPLILFPRSGQGISGRCFPNSMECSTTLCISTDPSYPQCHLDSSFLVQADLVPISALNIHPTPVFASTIFSRRILGHCYTHSLIPFTSVNGSYLVPRFGGPLVKDVLHSRRLSRSASYLHKWRCFSSWCRQAQVDPCTSPLHNILDYLGAQGGRVGLFIHNRSFVRVITAFHDLTDGLCVCRRLLMGLQNLHPLLRAPPPGI